jgi:hypothetical protein
MGNGSKRMNSRASPNVVYQLLPSTPAVAAGRIDVRRHPARITSGIVILMFFFYTSISFFFF